jgi:peptide/nickel transport system ATP-binding protein
LSATTEPFLAVRDLRVAFGGAPAVRGVDLVLERGGTLGMVGESGCGKSVTWLAALGLLPASATVSGSVRLEGCELIGASVRTLEGVRGSRIAMIFQDPASALNPVKRVGSQITESLARHRGMGKAAARAEARRLFEAVGIPDAGNRLKLYPHELSGGQNQRVMIAIALAGEPDLLVADEPTTALDATVQAQILALLQDLREQTSMGLILISHDLAVVGELCDRIVVMYAGRVVEQAPAEALFEHPAHPYTAGLLAAVPSLTGPRRRLQAIPGQLPEPWMLPPGCAFAPRCPMAEPECALAVPLMRSVAANHLAACRRL